MTQYLLSVIIPTKNRGDYVQKVLKQMLKYNFSDMQIVIQDNSDKDVLKHFIDTIPDKMNIKYNYTGHQISFVENFNIAVSMADGQYLCLIGDDDCVLPNIIHIARWAKSKNVKAVTPKLNAIYFWPDSASLTRYKKNDGVLFLDDFSFNIMQISTKKQLIKLLTRGAYNYLNLNLGKLYHGMVDRSVIQKIKDKTGSYFGGLSPDIYMSVSISLQVESVVYLDFPFTISGICQKSGSADSASGRHTGDYKSIPHLKGHSEYDWALEVPKFYSVETIWADSALAAFKDLHANEMKRYFNAKALSVKCFLKYPKYRYLCYSHYKKIYSKRLISSIIFFSLVLLFGTLSIIKKFTKKIFKIIINKTQVYKDISSIEKATIIVNDQIKKRKRDKNSFFKLDQ